LREIKNHKSQIPKLKQILITEIQNSKRDILSMSPFGALDIRIFSLFACPVGSMRPYQGYLVLGVWNYLLLPPREPLFTGIHCFLVSIQ